MQQPSCGEFQNTVSEVLIRHRSVLDVMSKLQEANARVNRAVTKAVTNCGCLRINASRQKFPENITLMQLRGLIDTHLEGSLCQECRDALESEIGTAMFYLTAICDLLHLSLDEIVGKKHRQISTLGVFNLT